MSVIEPFFLATPTGDLFCIHHPAPGTLRGAVLYVPPFAEEMNKSRRMAALQSRAFAASGFAVLQIDLHGCGDSSGEFADATWTIWRQNVETGIEWLERRYGGPVMLWGLRSGGLLALDAASRHPPGGELILWQPVQDGKAMITQFLRLRIASEMLAQGKAETGVAALRARIAQGDEVEVAGYAMTKGITAAIDDLTLSRLQPSGWRVHWFEVVPDAGRELPPAARRVVDDWRNHGIAVDAHCVAGEPFWNTMEIAECPALIELTTAALTTAEMAAP